MGCIPTKLAKHTPGYEDPTVLASETSCESLCFLLTWLLKLKSLGLRQVWSLWYISLKWHNVSLRHEEYYESSFILIVQLLYIYFWYVLKCNDLSTASQTETWNYHFNWNCWDWSFTNLGWQRFSWIHGV